MESAGAIAEIYDSRTQWRRIPGHVGCTAHARVAVRGSAAIVGWHSFPRAVVVLGWARACFAPSCESPRFSLFIAFARRLSSTYTYPAPGSHHQEEESEAGAPASSGHVGGTAEPFAAFREELYTLFLSPSFLSVFSWQLFALATACTCRPPLRRRSVLVDSLETRTVFHRDLWSTSFDPSSRCLLRDIDRIRIRTVSGSVPHRVPFQSEIVPFHRFVERKESRVGR